ncbi:MAG TPA: HD domain-containing phosphohydrolase [Nitrospiria bacterium]|nr:HD domain-containing phosphohydrolase [Nitrospiria bacterium]HUK55165.1 HD domain-containing phosphohydrolase [Nitrospiria bacterium]
MSQCILIVDDEEHIRRLCSEILKHESYQTFTAASAKAAVELARLQPFDLLLTDISMPGMDGLKLLRTIKEIQKEIVSVVMTGYGTIDNAVEAMKLGAQGFVIKPFSEEELVQSVRDALEKYRLLRENMRLKLLVPLFEVGKTLLSDLHLKSLLETFVRVVSKETRSDAAAVMLVDDRTYAVKPESCFILPDGISNETFQRIRETFGPWAMEKKIPLLLEDGTSLTDDMKSLLHRSGLAAVVIVPFVSKDRLTGILILCKRPGNASYNPSDLELASILCGQAAIAIENAKLFEVIEAKNRELEDFYFETVNALAQAIEVKDVYTGGHGDRLVDLAISIAERLNVSSEERIWLKYAAALHDIGKIGVKETILTKPGKLTPEEYEEMKTHPAKGAEILREVKFLAPVVPIVYHHQERYDGKGYPTGLSGHQIPIGSRIVAVLDAFDAMTTNRPYRKGLPTEVAINELRRHSGVQFDPQVVEAFIQVVTESPHTA